jgi:hypothetical protein
MGRLSEPQPPLAIPLSLNYALLFRAAQWYNVSAQSYERGKQMKVLFSILLMVPLILPCAALGGMNPDCKVAVHALPNTSRTCYNNFPVIEDCRDMVTTEPSTYADCFVVFFDLDEYIGMDFGLTWPGPYSAAWTHCADMAIGNIVWPGDGFSCAWYICQSDPVKVVGWATIYGVGRVCVVQHPGVAAINVGDCYAGLDSPTDNFCAGIGGTTGDDPCPGAGIEPIENQEDHTWSSIKAFFE